MLVQDTVHSTVEAAPLINAALGITIRGAGLTRHEGGMHGFWRGLVGHYRSLGGRILAGRVDPAERGRIVGSRPPARPGTPEEIAQAVHFRASAPFVTGQVLAVDGGRSIFL